MHHWRKKCSVGQQRKFGFTCLARMPRLTEEGKPVERPRNTRRESLTICLLCTLGQRTLKLRSKPDEANMDQSLLSRNTASKCIMRVEAPDEQLRHLRLKVEIHASQLLKSSGTEREQAYQLYKLAMRRLLNYLQTNSIDS
jgi:hypothetical protein